MNIAVVGSGISGLTAAYLLSRRHRVTLFERNNYVGGHTATRDVELDGRKYAVDTGFIVYNRRTYPQFCKLLAPFGLPEVKTSMGFSVTTPDRSLEYCGSGLNALFARRRNLLRPLFLEMLVDIARFNARARRDYIAGTIDAGSSLETYLDSGNYGSLFREAYILPMAAAIWSCPRATVKQFQALFFIRFFINHGLLNLRNRPDWLTLANGSRTYITPLAAPFRDRLHTGVAVRMIRRATDHVLLRTEQAEHRFDQVVLATHSDQALALLHDADAQERRLLRAIPYRANAMTLHTDTSVLPVSRRAWTSWNYLLDPNKQDQPVLTYNMNILQRLDAPQTLCVTVNGEDYLDEDRIIERFSYSHPQFSAASIKAQQEWASINGVRRTWYCGAWWRNGFHEDGVVSGIKVAERLGVTWEWA